MTVLMYTVRGSISSFGGGGRGLFRLMGKLTTLNIGEGMGDGLSRLLALRLFLRRGRGLIREKRDAGFQGNGGRVVVDMGRWIARVH